ncbi:cytochrome P450 [Streptomyces sp. NPDC058417]|uniref:cytochrome P450 family protein n=1 Tax=unclassified Streptomyces TaxID=2593676 RepID=UPI003666ACA8
MATPPPAQPLVLDPTGSRRRSEHTLLRQRGAATEVDILGVRAWAVSDPDVLKDLLTSDQVSKDPRAHWPAFSEVIQTWPLALWVAVENMFTAFGDDHRRLRRMISPALSARRTDALAPFVDTTVTGLLDRLAAHPGDSPVDLREHLAYPLPIAVISHLMGVPADQHDDFRRIVDGVFSTTLTTAQATANTAALYAALDQLITTRRTHPGDDLTSALIAVRDDEGDGRTLSPTELRDTLLLMISAGYQTTVDLIDQAITLLLTHPEQLRHVLDGRATWNHAVEEVLRLEAPVTHLPLRYARSDIRLTDGTTIPQGAAVLASYGAANRHPAWHTDADTFDVTRTSTAHLAFGHGVHFCLGAPLARLEVTRLLAAFFTRFPHTALAVPAHDLQPVNSLISNGHRELPVHLTPPAQH